MTEQEAKENIATTCIVLAIVCGATACALVWGWAGIMTYLAIVFAALGVAATRP